MTRDTTTERLPEAVRVLLDEARECGGESRWGDALAKNLDALRVAEAANDKLGCAVAHRYVGLSHYRLDTAEHLERSAEHLRKARDIAASLGDHALALKIDNHLGATLRQLGRYDEADKVFRDALRATEARPELVEVRARLLGNLGAMLDELDQREQAADCYARYEEIVVSARDEERIANARGLVGRAALKRGDFDEAEWRFDEEARLSRSLRLAAREVEAALHHGRLAHARWREAPPDLRAERATEAHAHFARAIELNREAREAQTKMTTRLDLAYGEFLLDGGQLVESYAHFRDAKSGAVRMGIEVLASKADHGLAVTCRKAGLHGEALWHLAEAVRRRADLVSAMTTPRVREMARAWFVDLQELTQELSDEVLRVPRSERERESIEQLRQRLDAMSVRQPPRGAVRPRVDPWEWIDGLCREGTDRWTRLVGREEFLRLHEDSRADLVRSEVAYHGAIDDLGRSLHLMAVAVERELRSRMKAPLERYAQTHKASITEFPQSGVLKDAGNLSLGDLLSMASALGKPCWQSMADEVFSGADAALASVRAFGGTLRTVDQREVSLKDLRNAVAHGRDAPAGLDRLEVDAIKRALVLDAPVLRDLARWPTA